LVSKRPNQKNKRSAFQTISTLPETEGFFCAQNVESFPDFPIMPIMHGISAKDEGRDIVWSNSSKDYATRRSGPSKKFYDLLKAMNLGLPR